MNSFKNHFSLILALSALLASIQFVRGLDVMIAEYETNLSREYSMITISQMPLDTASVKQVIPQVSEVEAIDPTEMIDSLRSNLSEANLAYLKVNLPRFYRIKLQHYPSIQERSRITQALRNISGVQRVESFEQSQNTIYRLLLLNKGIIWIFAGLLSLIAFLLMVRQMEVWRFEHSDRMQIMSILGAPLWMRSGVLFRMAFFDSILSSLAVAGLYSYLGSSPLIQKTFKEAGLLPFRYNVIDDTVLLFMISLIVSICSVIYVVIKAEDA